MKTAICLQAGNGNPGDSIANLGCRGLFQAAVPGGVIYDSWHMAEPESLRYDLIDFYAYHYGLVLCTPWLWDRCAKGVKYGLLSSFLDRIVAPHKYAMGTGSSYHLDLDYHDSQKEGRWGARAVEESRSLWKDFEHVTCRDRLAFSLYSKMLPEHQVTLLPCPSFYIAQVFDIVATKEKEDLLVFCEINPKIFWKIREDQTSKPMTYQDELVYSGIETMTMIPLDYEAFKARYGREPTHYLRDPLAIVKTLGQYKRVTSARVHACMPSLSLGLDVEIIPLDTRALTATALGAKPIINSLEGAELFADPIEKTPFEEMVKLIREKFALADHET